MNTKTTNETLLEADPTLPTVRITREFQTPPERVFRAYTDRDLFAPWAGPKDITSNVVTWDARTGGECRYTAHRDGEEIATFYGSFHEVRPSERIVQTFTFEGYPDGVSLETATFEDLGNGRTRVTSLGVVEGYEKLGALLAQE